MIGRYLSLMAVRAALRLAARLARAAAIVLLAVAAAPVSLVAALAVTLAWLGGWPPRRLYRAALAAPDRARPPIPGGGFERQPHRGDRPQVRQPR